MITAVREILQNAIEELDELERLQYSTETEQVELEKDDDIKTVLQNYFEIRDALFLNKLSELELREEGLKDCLPKKIILKNLEHYD